MEDKKISSERLSPWWRNSVILILVVGFAVLIWVAARSYKDAPPIPERVLSQTGETIFTREDILTGQQGFSEVRLDGKWYDLGTWRLPGT